jgi:hypothetical protein
MITHTFIVKAMVLALVVLCAACAKSEPPQLQMNFESLSEDESLDRKALDELIEKILEDEVKQ